MLACRDVDSGRSFWTLLNVESYPVAFAKAFETGCVDCRMMNKQIRSVFLLDEAEAFLVVKPFYDAIGHDNVLLS
jgi:hypothetical protein